jgi:hypothetical protein
VRIVPPTALRHERQRHPGIRREGALHVVSPPAGYAISSRGTRSVIRIGKSAPPAT